MTSIQKKTRFLVILLLTVYVSLVFFFAKTLLIPLTFGFGVLLQSIFILRKDVFSGLYVLCILVSLTGLLPGRKEAVYSLDYHIVMSFTIFAMLLALMFKDKLMVYINELTLFQITIILIYMNFVIELPFLSWVLPVLTYWSVIFVALLVVTKSLMHQYLKIGLYVWFLLISTFILLIQFIPEIQAFLSYPVTFRTKTDDMMHAFVAGMLFLPLSINFWYLWELVPLPGKRQSFSDKMAEVKEHAKEMKKKYSDYQLTWQNAVYVLMIQGGILIINHQLDIIPNGVAIGISLILVDLMVFAHVDVFSLVRNGLLMLIGRQQSTS
ncbi:MAG: hypothetical protein ACEQSA_00815 [Weeksellaceae bacterium]